MVFAFTCLGHLVVLPIVIHAPDTLTLLALATQRAITFLALAVFELVPADTLPTGRAITVTFGAVTEFCGITQAFSAVVAEVEIIFTLHTFTANC